MINSIWRTFTSIIHWRNIRYILIIEVVAKKLEWITNFLTVYLYLVDSKDAMLLQEQTIEKYALGINYFCSNSFMKFRFSFTKRRNRWNEISYVDELLFLHVTLNGYKQTNHSQTDVEVLAFIRLVNSNVTNYIKIFSAKEWYTAVRLSWLKMPFDDAYWKECSILHHG